MTTTTATQNRTNTSRTAPTTTPSSAPIEAGPDARLADMASSAEPKEAAATFEGTKAGPAHKAFNPPPQPRLISDAKVTDPEVKQEIRTRNEQRIRAYNAAYESYLSQYAEGVKVAPTLDHIKRLGEPVSYDPLASLPASERAQYDCLLASPSVQNARAVYEAIELRRLEDSGERGPLDIGVKASLEAQVGAVKGGASYDGTKAPGSRGGLEVGGAGDVQSLKKHFDEKAPEVKRDGYVSTEKGLAADKAKKSEENWKKPNASFDVSVDQDGNVTGGASLSIGKAFGVTGKRTEDGIEGGVSVLGQSVTIDKDGFKSVTLDAELVKVSYEDGKLTTEGGIDHEIEIAGVEGSATAKVTTTYDGSSAELGTTVGGGIEGVLAVEGSVAVNVNMVSEKWVKHTITSNGFFR